MLRKSSQIMTILGKFQKYVGENLESASKKQ